MHEEEKFWGWLYLDSSDQKVRRATFAEASASHLVRLQALDLGIFDQKGCFWDCTLEDWVWVRE